MTCNAGEQQGNGVPNELHAFAFDSSQQCLETVPIVLIIAIFNGDDRVFVDLLKIVRDQLFTSQLVNNERCAIMRVVFGKRLVT